MHISYVHEDLVFMEHNAFLFQFTSKSDELLVHRNEEADDKIISSDISRLQVAAAEKNMSLNFAGLYKLSQADDANIHIEFL